MIKRKPRNDIKFNGLQKLSIRQIIANELIIRKIKCFLDFWGNGEMYRFCKKLGIKIFSIDNGSDFVHLPKERKALKKILTGYKDRAYMSLKQLCKTKSLFDGFWLDYCGPLGKKVWKDLELLPNIMADKGILFITFQEGHERLLPAGTDRRVIDIVYGNVTETVFRKMGIKTKEIFKYRYISKPDYGSRKKLNGTPMITIGLTWQKINTKHK